MIEGRRRYRRTVNIAVVGSALSRELEKRCGPGELNSVRCVGYRPEALRWRGARHVVFWIVAAFTFGRLIPSQWGALAAPVAAIAGVASYVVVGFLETLQRRARKESKDDVVAVQVTSRFVLATSSDRRRSATRVREWDRDDLDAVSTGTVRPLSSGPCSLLRFRFRSGEGLELAVPALDLDGIRTSLRLTGVRVLDLDGQVMEGDASGGNIAGSSVPSEPERAAASGRGWPAVITLLMVVSMFVGVWAGHRSQPWLIAGFSQALTAQCVDAVEDVLVEGEAVADVHFRVASLVGRGAMLEGYVDLRGDAAEALRRSFTCTKPPDSVMTASLQN